MITTHRHTLSADPTGSVGIIKLLIISLLLLIINSSVFAAPVTNAAGTKAIVTATELSYHTAPAGSVSGSALTTQPSVKAQDAFGNTDTDYTNTVTLTEASSGSLSGESQAAVSGIATFTALSYTATTDGESFILTALDGSSITNAIAASITSDVVATQLAFTTQPAPTSLEVNVTTNFTTVPVVSATDGNNTVDTDFSKDISLTENGTGTGSFTNATKTATNGIATFTGLTLSHDTAESLQLVADDVDSTGAGLPAVNSATLTIASNSAPTISGAVANQAVDDNATLTPFSNITLADSDGNNLSVAITLDDGAKGGLSVSSIASGSIASVQAALRAIVFTPTANRVAVGSTETTTFTLSVNDGTNAAVTNNTTTVVSTSINNIPTDIALSSNTVAKGTTTVGTLSTTDVDKDETFTYTLVSGTGDDNNASFSINSSTLETAVTLDAGDYKVRIKTDDSHSSGTFEKAFTITVTDSDDPTIVSLSPLDNATGVATNTNLVITLSESVEKGTGDILIKASTDDSVIDTIDVTGSQVSISGAVITIDPSVILTVSTEYYVEIPATAFKDSSDNFFAGITDTTTWSFTTSATKTVPSGQPTSFVTTTGATSVTTTWTDAIGAVTPDRYLVMCSTTNSFTDPTDGIEQPADSDCSDGGAGIQTVAAGTQTVSWTGLTRGTEYFFKIFPYTNTGTDVLYKTDGTVLTGSATPSVDADATLTAGDGVTEPVDLPSTIDTIGKAIDLFDFKLNDGGTSDGVSTDVTQIVVHTSGTGDFSKVVWRLNGDDAINIIGVYDETENTITFSSLTISIADGSNEIYTINAYFGNNSGIIDNSTFLLSIDGASNAAGGSDITVDEDKTQMAADAIAM